MGQVGDYKLRRQRQLECGRNAGLGHFLQGATNPLAQLPSDKNKMLYSRQVPNACHIDEPSNRIAMG